MLSFNFKSYLLPLTAVYFASVGPWPHIIPILPNGPDAYVGPWAFHLIKTIGPNNSSLAFPTPVTIKNRLYLQAHNS